MSGCSECGLPLNGAHAAWCSWPDAPEPTATTGIEIKVERLDDGRVLLTISVGEEARVRLTLLAQNAVALASELCDASLEPHKPGDPDPAYIALPS